MIPFMLKYTCIGVRRMFSENTHDRQKKNPKKGREISARALASGFVLSLSVAFSTLYADDTEVFFGQGTNSNQNVLFVLDTSGSMNFYDSGYSGTRLARMKSALNDILDSSSNLNVGLMRFNGYYGGGSVIYPMTGIDEPVCVSGCGLETISARVIEADDDMEQFVDTGEMTPSGNRLSLGTEDGNEQLAGFRFQEIIIPSGAEITSATIDFTAERSDTEVTQLQIAGLDIDDAPSISHDANTLSNGTTTSASVDWTPESWSIGDVYSTPDLSTVVQEIIDRSGWCGGQSLGFIVSGSGERAALSYNNNPGKAALLRVSYNTNDIPSGKGCIEKQEPAQVRADEDDAQQTISSGQVKSNNLSVALPQTPFTYESDVMNRLRFEQIDIPQGATIVNATISMITDTSLNGSLSVDIDAEASDDAPDLAYNNSWISSRPAATASPVQWDIGYSDGSSYGVSMATTDLATLVQAVVNRSGWQSGNAMAFRLKPSSGSSSNSRSFDSYDYSPGNAPRLQITYRVNTGDTAGSTAVLKTARDDMKQAVNELSADGGTPIVSAYYEAVQYMLGGAVDYGLERGIDGQKHRYHRVSHPNSYTGGYVSRDTGCTDENIESDACKSEHILGNPIYKSPLGSSCQTSHIVFLSDGVPTSNSAISKVQSLLDIDSCDPSLGNEACGVELAQWLNETDHNPVANHVQNINTYTIGFNIESEFLQRLATAGGGSYKDANSSSELVAVFEDIIGDVLAVDTSFVAPGATVNQFNRLTHRNDIYFASFKPASKPRWSGNLKRYHAEAQADGTIEIQDREGDLAVDTETGFFSEDAKSFWGTDTDGFNVDLGGAANKLSLAGPGGIGDRRVFTHIGAIPSGGIALTVTSHKLHESNTDIQNSMIGADNQTERNDLLSWARGVDIFDEDLDLDSTDIRAQMGDPLHAKPVILNYASGSDTHTTVFMATNQGMLHALENENGTELFAFMPEELLPNIELLYDNRQQTSHPYGLDGDITIWHDDTNSNVMVDGDESAYLFVGMRRGGDLYYAFDVSDRLNPKLLWKIQGGQGDFQHLAQTWSKPVPTRIKRNGVERDVVMFAGGYDDNNNDPSAANLNSSQTHDSKGAAVFIVDTATGQKIWAGTGDTTGDKKFTSMTYSIPSDMRVIDINADGFADQMYVGDMGGQLWRFDITPNHTSGALVDGGVIADLNGAGIANARRFYNEPDVALIAHDGERSLSVSIGSGWRAHPLNTSVSDRFYMINQTSVYNKPEGYGKNTGTALSQDWKPLTESDLSNVTDELDPTVTAHGWFIEMEAPGEKILGNSITVNNQVIFTSYEPVATGDPCSPAAGGGSIYVLDVLNGSPTLDLDTSDQQDDDATDDDTNTSDSGYNGQSLTKEDRKRTLQQGGIPPSASALVTESTDTDGAKHIGTTIMAGTEQLDVDFNLTRRTYWQDRGRGDQNPAQTTASSEED